MYTIYQRGSYKTLKNSPCCGDNLKKIWILNVSFISFFAQGETIYLKIYENIIMNLFHRDNYEVTVNEITPAL